MLGGSVWIALLRYVISLAGVILLFSRMSESQFDRKKTVICYGCFSVVLITLVCIWYVADWKSCVRISAILMYICFAVFAIIMSRDSIYLSIYKLALTFYLMAVFLVGGLETAILFFDRNVWADIIIRVVLILIMTLLIERKLKDPIKDFSAYMEREADKFSVATMIICILFGIGFILNPNVRDEMTPYRLYQIAVNFILTGTLQLLIFRFCLHVGKEKEYEKENQLMQMNHRLLERQLEILEESAESGRRLRHDMRHHNAVIAEYVRRGQNEELLEYLKEYDRETHSGMVEKICANIAVNHILSAYTRKARDEQISVTLNVELDRDVEIPGIDLVTILANAYENAIFACVEAKKQEGRDCFIHLTLKKKKNKLIISCRNTCSLEAEMKNGQPKAEFTGGIGVSSIIKTAEKYEGEYDFKIDHGVFVFRLIMIIPKTL